MDKVLTKEMQKRLYFYVMEHCNTKDDLLTRSLRGGQNIFVDFDLYHCLQLLGLEKIKPEHIKQHQSSNTNFFSWDFKLTQLSQQDLNLIEKALQETVILDKQSFNEWLAKFPEKLVSNSDSERLKQVLHSLGVGDCDVLDKDNYLQIKFYHSEIANKSTEEILQLLDKRLEQKKVCFNIYSAMQKASGTLDSTEKKSWLEKISQDFWDLVNQVSPRSDLITSELQNFTDMLIQRPEAFRGNILQAMYSATNRWFVAGDEKFKKLKDFIEEFNKSKQEYDYPEIIRNFLLTAAEPRGCFLTSEFAKTKSCQLFFQSLNTASKKQLLKILGKPDIQNPSFDDFSQSLQDLQQLRQNSKPNK